MSLFNGKQRNYICLNSNGVVSEKKKKQKEKDFKICPFVQFFSAKWKGNENKLNLFSLSKLKHCFFSTDCSRALPYPFSFLLCSTQLNMYSNAREGINTSSTWIHYSLKSYFIPCCLVLHTENFSPHFIQFNRYALSLRQIMGKREREINDWKEKRRKLGFLFCFPHKCPEKKMCL